MIKRKRTKAFTHAFQKTFKALKRFIIRNIQWLLRSIPRNSRRHRESGFVLPTTVMLLLIVTLVVTALIFRTFSRTTQTISERQQQVIYNSATPAVDRAKAKLEYLFRQDSRLPAGIPSDSTIQNILQQPATGDDLYTLPGETRLTDFKDANNNPGIGWYFKDPNKDDRVIAYSIIFKKQAANASGGIAADIKNNLSVKAPYLVVRNGPVNVNNSSGGSCGTEIQLVSNERDWESITSATLAKTFQVTAFAVENANKPNRSVTTLELQQDRQADKGNKWGAYFRYDLELFQGPTFNWNGAMHSDGNMFFGSFGSFKAHLISSPSSCVNTSANDSRVTVSRYTNPSTGDITFEGQLVAGRLTLENYETTDISKFDLYNGSSAPSASPALKQSTDSVIPPDSPHTTVKPSNLALDPVALFINDEFRARGADPKNVTYRDSQWQPSNFVQQKRLFNEETIPPYLDDTYRADDRYGPNPTYDGKPLANSQIKIPSGKKVGDTIPTTDTNYSALTRNTPPSTNNPEALGLDGYWERRAVKGGLRVIVGQRLELGNLLAVPSAAGLPSGREHEFLQRRNQRDNLAAVQATAVYHYKSGSGSTPVACMATTVHPGTPETLRRSATFDMMRFQGASASVDRLITDFFTGRGTNGWEFSVPAESTALASARTNLANFAGDSLGAFPPTQENAGGVVHPNPAITRYGDFSNLRRALSGTSVADQAYKDTANCMLGMLAYNISYLDDYVYANNWDTDTTNATVQLLDNLNAALSDPTFSSVAANSPEQTIALLENPSTPIPASNDRAKLVQLARLIATKEQVKLDRGNALESNGTTPYSCNNATFNAAATNLNKLCPTRAGGTYASTDVKYGALYYIFPTNTNTGYTTITNADITSIKTSPLLTTWNIPRVTRTFTAPIPASLPNYNTTDSNNLIKYTDAAGVTTYYQVAFKDAALFNGREMMSVRVLDVDLNLLRATNAPGGDTWLPINDNTASDPNAPPPNGLVYAFREDAVREDAIARPKGSAMNAISATPTDPTIPTSGNGITTKPVDYYPDPDRRPYGFRLKNGARLDRGTNPAGTSFVSDNPVYIQGDFNLHSTDGTNSPSTLLEEFKNADTTSATPDAQGKLKDDWSNFYTRNRKDDRFAKPATDTWRPTEVLGDAVTILSNNFCDGSIQDGIDTLISTLSGANSQYNNPSSFSGLATQYGCNTSVNFTSYYNQNRPWVRFIHPPLNQPSTSTWNRENPYDPGSPIEISPNGKPIYCTTALPCLSANRREYELLTVPSNANYPDTYLRFSNQGCPGNRKCMGVANATRVNAIIVQNIIPSQAGQSYGGFHAFPRLIENWNNNVPLDIAGAFIQLRFSTQSTGSFDQDAWEPGQAAISSGTNHEFTWYFLPPARRWGYDVALQLQTAGPVARRFTVPGTTRTEVYRELPIDDPYVEKLRCAKDSAGNRIDSAAICS
ncbi:MAG: hormogonium polysaccharide biosynthesis protein HpsA [Goleter apudmare HA4340-LM2]|nr:hormogonium polysaccharide biosynthesis protein HpsA [Goleter apudmare HA4340-LM2]